MSKVIFGSLLCASVALGGCQSSSETSKVPMDTQQKPMAEAKEEKGPQLLADRGDAVLFRHNGRIYVVTKAMSEKFEKHGHLPYAKTLIGEGPKGETIIYEIDKKDPEAMSVLMKAYEDTPILMEQRGENFFAFSKSGRIVIIGSKVMADKFEKHGHLPYAKTVIGGGKNGETLVFEIEKKHPEMTARLEAVYRSSMI